MCLKYGPHDYRAERSKPSCYLGKGPPQGECKNGSPGPLARGPVSEKDKLQIPLEEKLYVNRKGKNGNTDHRNNLGRC